MKSISSGLLTFFSLILPFTSYAYWDLTELWGGDYGKVGSVTYSGPAIRSIQATVPGLTVGQMEQQHNWCTTTDIFYYGLKRFTYDKFIFFPDTISLGNNTIKVSRMKDPNGFAYEGLKNALWLPSGRGNVYLYRQTGGISTQDTQQICFKVGSHVSKNVSYPGLTVELDISNLKNGSYNGSIPVYYGYANYYSKDYTDSIRPLWRYSSNNALNDNGKPNYLDFNITITSKCTIPDQITLDHGNISFGEAENHTKSEVISLSCSGSNVKGVKLALKPSGSTPSTQYTGGIGVGLGHGWDSLLNVNNGASATVDINGSANITLKSVLKKTKDSQVGALSGSAILDVSFP